MMANFHFLFPVWLLALPAIAFVWWQVRRHEASSAKTGEYMASHLRDALLVNNDAQKGVRAVDGVCIVLLLAALAAAGPTWTRQASPWFEETAPLVIAIEVSDSMRSNDFQPTRLDRARFKVQDLVAARTGSRTALIAYAGSAHIVVPPTKDPQILKPFLESLDPTIMPVPGARASAVMPLAMKMLGDHVRGGTVLFINDGFSPEDIAELAKFSADSEAPALAALVIGTAEGGVAFMPDGSPVMSESGGRIDTRVDEGLVRKASAEADIAIVRASVGDRDIARLLRTIDSNLRQANDADAVWKNQGWWLLWPALLLALLWFRRGWTMQW